MMRAPTPVADWLAACRVAALILLAAFLLAIAAPLMAQAPDSVKNFRVMRPAETDSTVWIYVVTKTLPPDTLWRTDSLYCSAASCPPGVWSKTKPVPPDTTTPNTCGRTVNAATLPAFAAALGSAQAGDCIHLAPGTYLATADIRITKSGTAAKPITIQGAGYPATTIDMQLRQFTLDKVQYVKLRKMRLTNHGSMGVRVRDSRYNELDSLEIDNARNEALAFKNLASYNKLLRSWIHNTGTKNPQWGEGVYVGGSADSGYAQNFGVIGNEIIGNKIGPDVRAQAVDVSPGADSTVIVGNAINSAGSICCGGVGYGSRVDSYGKGVVVEGNTVTGGTPNAFRFLAPSTGTIVRHNTVDMQNKVWPGFTGFGFNLTAGTNTGQVRIECSNRVTNGAFSNVACQ